MRDITTLIVRSILLTCACFLLAATNLHAVTTWTVTKTQDISDGVCDADCSLREAIAVAADGDTIDFSSLFNTPQTVIVVGTLYISRDIAIAGPGADLLTLNGRFSFQSGVAANLSGMTLTMSGAFGATTLENYGSLRISQCVLTGNPHASAITNHGELFIDDSTISENHGQDGGGIENYDGDLTLNNSTVSNNVGFGSAFGFQGGAGGIYSSGGTLTITNSTISGNEKNDYNFNGGGIWIDSETVITSSTIANNRIGVLNPNPSSQASGVYAQTYGSVTIRSTIIAGNVNNSTLPDVIDVTGPVGIASDGYNLIGNASGASTFNAIGDQTGTTGAPLNPRLDPLDDYGGMTATHRLQANSPAIDNGFSFGLTTDQRGFARPWDKTSYPNAPGGDGSDIGAYELHFTIVISGRVFDGTGNPLKNVRVLLRSATGERRAVRTDRFGMYRFDHVARNRTYQVTPMHRVYQFTPRIVMVQEANIANLNFVASP